MDVACRLILIGEARLEQQRFVGAERDAGVSVEEELQGDVAQVTVDAELHVRRRAHLERDALIHHALQQFRVLDGADVVADSGGLEVIEDLLDVARPEQFPAVRHPRKSGAARDAERALPFGGAALPFGVAEPEPADFTGAIAGVLGGDSGEGAGVARGRRMREAATMMPTWTPVSAEADFASSHTMSSNGCRPPTCGA